VWQQIYHMPAYRWSFKTADQCIVLNREAKLFLEFKYGLPPYHVWYIPNGVGPEFCQQRSFPEDIAPKLLFVGTWIDHKGIYYLPPAFDAVRAALPGAQLTVAGCQAPEEEVRRAFSTPAQQALRVQQFVRQSEMPGLYAGHDIFVLPSLVEGMPLVLLEAMASEMPVVTTESCGMTDVVEDGHDGLLVPPADAELLATAILGLCRDRDLRRRLGTAAGEKMKRFTWARAAKLHEQVFLRALDEKQFPRG
jgi:glycosyltransferase involved in cell wall biosynthesis